MCSLASLFIRSLLEVELTLMLRRTRSDISLSVESMGFSSTEKFRGWRKPIRAGKPAHHTPQGQEGGQLEFLVQAVIL